MRSWRFIAPGAAAPVTQSAMDDPATRQAALTRRVRALVRTAPLHAMEAHKNNRSIDLQRHDLRLLALAAIEAVVERMGFGYGASRDEVRERLLPLLSLMEPGIALEAADRVVELVLEELLNSGNRRLAFEVPYVSLEGGQGVARAVRFHLLREEETEDGEIVLKATTEAINLYAGMLEVDVEDAQIAEEAILRAQIQRGALQQAEATARQARLRSIEYAETIRQSLRLAKRDISQVRASQFLAVLERARTHLDGRLQEERRTVEAVRHRISQGGGEARAWVALRELLEECESRHTRLLEDVLNADSSWLAEQEQQRFKRRRNSHLPGPDREVLQPMLVARQGDLAPHVDEVLRLLHGPVPPPVLSLQSLIRDLMQPRRSTEAAPDRPPVVLELISEAQPRFPAAAQAAVQGHLAACRAGGTLSGRLAASRASGEGVEVRRLLVLVMLQAWDTGLPVQVRRAGALDDPEYAGDDLAIVPASVPASREGDG